MRCPVTILGHACDREIGEREGELVMSGDGRGWIVCAPCARRGVRIADVEHAPTLLETGS